MGRDREPIGKSSRNLRVNLAETPKIDALMKRRPYPSGQHGQARKKLSEYAIQLQEKQRLRLRFGIREKQLRRYYDYASRKKGNTGTILLQQLERRFDNVLFRARFAKTRRQARQLCSHSHLIVNGVRTDIPSFQLREGDIITVRDGSKELFKNLIEACANDSTAEASWLTIDSENLSIRFDRLPEREELDSETREQLVIEYYSR